MPDLGQVETTKRVDVIDVITHGDKIVIPENMTLVQVDKAIHQKMAIDEQDVTIMAPIPGMVHEAAYAFWKAMERKHGWVNQVTGAGGRKPASITVEVARGKSVQLPWGRFELPYFEGYLECNVGPSEKDPRVGVFIVTGVVKHKHQERVNELVDLAKQILREESIYKGQAFRLKLRDEDGDPLPIPMPTFLDLKPEVENELVFPEGVMRQVGINLFTPIEQTDRVRKAGIPLKRGVLLAGDFGVGKTMLAHACALKCVRNGWTYIVCENSNELPEVLRVAYEYGPALVFCEDIDRIMSGDRTVAIDHILNVIDGVESKNADLMIVLTTNDVENVHPAMLRPGRLDATIKIERPDAEAAERLARQYGRGLLSPDEDITEAALAMADQIPAVVREVVERSKLAAIYFEPDIDAPLRITNQALIESRLGMEYGLQLLQPKPQDTRSETVKAAEIVAGAYERTIGGSVAQPLVVLPTHPSEQMNDEYENRSRKQSR